jgi:mannose-1-phosphate guanylyltransferase
MQNRYIVIMAGGIGTRFWPLSRGSKPKQFLDILNDGTTLLQDTVKRFDGLCPKDNIYIVTSESHRSLVLEQVDIPEENVLAEPMRRNTAPCIAYAAFRIFNRDPEAIMVVSPADHHITEEDNFIRPVSSKRIVSRGSRIVSPGCITSPRFNSPSTATKKVGYSPTLSDNLSVSTVISVQPSSKTMVNTINSIFLISVIFTSLSHNYI